MIYCQACGNQMHEDARACPSCGRPNALAVSALPVNDGYFTFNGRISRKTFWLHYQIPLLACSLFAGVLDAVLHAHAVLRVLVGLLLWVPSLAGQVKRLHDRDHSGWMLLLCLVPVIGWIWLFVVLGCLRGTPGPNRFGPDPLRRAIAASPRAPAY